MPRILHISTRLILGGSQENTVLSCEGQARLGHEVHLAFGPIYGPEGSLLDRVHAFNRRCASGEETTADVPPRACRPISTHTISHLTRELEPRSDRHCYAELKDLIAALNPAVVHTHSSKAGILGRAAAWAVYKSRLKTDASPRTPAVVHTIHGPPFMPVEGPALRRLKIRAVNKLYETAERFAARRCHTLISVADAMTRQFLARGIGTPAQYTTVYSGMDIQPLLIPGRGESLAEMRDQLGFVDSDIVVGTVARLSEHKGHDDLLDALAPDLQSNPSLKFLWVGDGWWRQRLLDKARALGLSIRELDRTTTSRLLPSSPAQLTLTGLLAPVAIPAHLRAMDILAHPSYREGLPRTVPQALLCGVAPVAYDTDGTPEVCRDMDTGRLVKTGDRAALCAAILWLAEHPASRYAMAARGRELCRERFSAQAMINHLEDVYARALARAAER